MALLIVLSIVLALAGVALSIFGLRGRRVDDHPLCRACGFDLTGAPTTSDRCPECGRATTRPRIGHRRRRSMLIALGALLTAIALLAGGTVGVGIARGVDWRDKLPTRWLLREASSGTVADRADPIARLLARDANGALSAADRDALARAIVAVQPDRRIVWQGALGDWLAARVVAGTLPSDVRDAFVRNLLADATATLRPIVRQGDAPAVRIVFPQRTRGLSSDQVLYGEMYNGDRVLTIDGHSVAPVASGMGTILSSVGLADGGSSSEGPDAVDGWRAVGVGAHTVEWSQPIRIVAGPCSAATFNDSPAAMDARTICRTSLGWRGTVTVVPADDAAGVRLIDDPIPTAALRTAVSTPTIRLSAFVGSASILEMRYGSKLPVDLAAEVFVRQDGGAEQRLTTLTRLQSEEGGVASSSAASGIALHAGVAQLILRASPTVARRTTDLFDIWGGELRIDDVPVIDPNAKASTKPTTKPMTNASTNP